jgi:predicted ribosomally synthesized peptide with SipW-like signal peptide
MKKKVLLTSIMTIVLCLCLIAGSTFALFTDKTSFNIAVTSGDVEIEAYAKINSVWSAYGEGVTAAEDEYLVDENGHFYVHGKRDPIDGRYFFTNGGEAKLDGNNLVIDRITPGDRVDVDINVYNYSDVAISYRYKLVANDTNLATGMVVTVDGQSYEALASWTSEWYPVITAPEGKGADIPVKTISVELPVYAGNEYQTEKTENDIQSVTYTITVEAVQGNAVTDDEYQATVYPTQRAMETAIANAKSQPGSTVTIENGRLNNFEGLYVYDEALVISDSTLKSNYEDPYFVALTNYADTPEYVDITLENNSTVATTYGGQYTVFLHHVDGTDASNKLTIKAGSSIQANGDGSACIFVQLTKLDLYIEDADALVATNGAYALSATGNGHIVIHVPDSDVKAQIEAKLATPGYLDIDNNSTVTVVIG